MEHLSGHGAPPCPACGTPLDPTVRRCDRCGARVQAVRNGSHFVLTGQRCAHCGFDNEAGHAFCGFCGERLNVQCRRCGAANLAQRERCGACGAPLAGADLFALQGDWLEHRVLTDVAAADEMAAAMAHDGWELEARTAPTVQESATGAEQVLLHFRRRLARLPRGEGQGAYVRQQLAEDEAWSRQLHRSRPLQRLGLTILFLIVMFFTCLLFSDMARLIPFLAGR